MPSSPEVFEDDSPVGLWLVRLLLLPRVDDSVRSDFTMMRGRDEDEGDAAHRRRVQRRRVARLKRRLALLEKGALNRDAPVFLNIAHLATRIGLTDLERELVELGTQLRLVNSLARCFEAAVGLRRRELHSTIAHLLNATEEDVRAALAPKSRLVQAGLVAQQNMRDEEDSSFGVPHTLATMLERAYASCDDLFSNLFQEAKPTTLECSNFPHVAPSLDLACRLLQAAIARHTPGVNILVYGVPAAGKTELARVIAATIGARLFEVSVEDGDGDALSTDGRFAAYAISQRVLQGSADALLLFDETEGALRPSRPPAFFLHGEGMSVDQGRDKGWVNRILEDNPVPSIWIANGITRVDPAHLRRFSFVIELKTPPPRVRRAILDHCTSGLPVRDEWKTRRSHDARIAPGHIESAVRAARLVETADPAATEEVLSRLLDASLSAQGLVSRPALHHMDLGAWNPDFVHASCDLDRVAQATAKAGRGTILLYGAPGTGKSAYAHYVATIAGRELIVRRASDLLSMWLGDTEKNMARMFAEARASQSVLLLDEGDSFLQSRAGALHSWEVSQVNELLVQMEAFEGIFVCATNLVDSLDPAVFRRFALKVRFDPPRPEQRWRLFCETLVRLGLEPDERLRSSLDRATELTPGDFVAVLRRAELAGRPSDARELLDALEEERKMKPGCNRGEIGFGLGGGARSVPS